MSPLRAWTGSIAALEDRRSSLYYYVVAGAAAVGSEPLPLLVLGTTFPRFNVAVPRRQPGSPSTDSRNSHHERRAE